VNHTPLDIAAEIDNLLGDPVAIGEMELQARHDYLAMLAHDTCDRVTDLCRLYKRLQERGDKLGPLDLNPLIHSVYELETARRRYANDLRRHDGRDIVFEQCERYAGEALAYCVEFLRNQMMGFILDDARERAEQR